MLHFWLQRYYARIRTLGSSLVCVLGSFDQVSYRNIAQDWDNPLSTTFDFAALLSPPFSSKSNINEAVHEILYCIFTHAHLTLADLRIVHSDRSRSESLHGAHVILLPTAFMIAL